MEITLPINLQNALRHGESVVQFFSYSHLPEHLQAVSKPFTDLAEHIVTVQGSSNSQRTLALQKLLEAKDAAVRMVIQW